ncbi:TetR/AcrR family transcriptional regulator [Hoeflea sp. WL0058]|uniref:TetR/AcrR family transcriptional regulator n=1 Tax=Flavimaribacter sediminis TaxID=2865987 RepID=A0AAE3D028_9HYPH|nr:TetR/AcrR family transcriptional regulator [Flavimaribacter sediminis]MBW8636321.1 TetR/AcrR family transcriptional regulator [Flavimaribacter sediminis]
MSSKRWNNAVAGREEQRHRKQQAVLAAGAKLFIEKGYDKTSLDDIASALNVTKRALYYYFDSKDEILFDCHRQGLRFVEDIIDRSLDRSVPVLERISSLVGEYTEWVNSDFGACLVLIPDSSMTRERSDYLRKAKARLDHRVRELITEGIADGTIRECSPALTTAAIFGALNWIPFWHRNTSDAKTLQVKQEFTTFIENGLKKHPEVASVGREDF